MASVAALLESNSYKLLGHGMGMLWPSSICRRYLQNICDLDKLQGTAKVEIKLYQWYLGAKVLDGHAPMAPVQTLPVVPVQMVQVKNALPAADLREQMQRGLLEGRKAVASEQLLNM